MANSELTSLEQSLASTIADYREGEIPRPDPEHIHKWITQFEEDVRIPILRELDHVLKKTYFSKQSVTEFLGKLIKTDRLVGSDPCKFWEGACFFTQQGGGKSQSELLDVFDKALRAACDLKVKKCGSSSGPWVYLDDVLCSGNRVGTDICNWIKGSTPSDARVHIIVIAMHRYGQYSAKNRIEEETKKSDKKIRITWWRAVELEDRVSYIDTADVLRLVSVPNTTDAQRYYDEVKRASKYTPKFRRPGSKSENNIYSSEEGRHILEEQFFLAGLKIRSFCENPADIMRPLGYQGFPSFGFGALIATYRNCPNNCPLPLWWGDPKQSESHPLGKWYPLLPRKTHDQNFDYYFGNDQDA